MPVSVPPQKKRKRPDAAESALLRALAPPPDARPLAERCAPRTSLGCLYGDTAVAALRAWLMAGAAGPALATAAPGSGLSTLVRLLLRETGLESVWLGGAQPRLRAVLEHAVANPLTVTLRRKAVVIDDVDALAATDSAAFADVLACIRRRPPVQVLCLGHDSRSQKTYEYAKAWTRFALGRPSASTLAAYLRRVAEAHLPRDLDATLLDDVAKRCRGDVRAALSALDVYARAPPPPASGAAREPPAAAAGFCKDDASEGLDIVEALLRGEHAGVAGGLRAFRQEPSVVPMGLYENYVSALRPCDAAIAADVAHAYSNADLVDRYMYSRQCWDVFDAYGACAVCDPVARLGAAPRRALTVQKFGSVWSKLYNMCAKTKHVKSVNAKRAEHGLAPLGACDLASVRLMARAEIERGDAESIRNVAWPLSSQHVLGLMRLDPGGSAWYKQSSHARLKKALAE